MSMQYKSRHLFAKLDRTVGKARRIESEREQLELEKRRQATTQRVKKLAKDKLGMRPASPAITDYVSYQPYSGTVPAGATVQPRVSGGRLQ